VFRRFLIAILIFLIAVVMAADRVGAIVAAHVLAGKIQTDEHLPNRPSASIGGFPFLTQAFGGDYKSVTITAHEVPINRVSVTTLTAHLHGVHLPFSKVISGSVSRVPVDRVEGTAFLSFADANSYLAGHHVAGSVVRLRPGTNGTADVVDRLHIAGKAVSLHGVGTVSVSNNVVTVGVSHLTGSSSSTVLSLALNRLNVGFPLSGLPFRLHLTSVTVTSSGLSGTGEATDIVLGS
jgi:hypothetical protein